MVTKNQSNAVTKPDEYACAALMRDCETPASDRLVTAKQLSKRLDVSTKTISRWRKHGLMAEPLVINGRRQLGFRESAVRDFVSQNAARVRQSARFRPVNDDERTHIIQRVRELMQAGTCQTDIIRQVARETGRQAKMIRSMIKQFEKVHPELALFGEPRSRLTEEMRKIIYREYRRGVSVRELAERYSRSKTTIGRVIRKARAERIMQLPLKYVPSLDFNKPNAKKKILASLPKSEHTPRKTRQPTGLPSYLKSLYQMPLLTRQQEVHLFRKLNFLKYRASRLRDKLDVARPQVRLMDEIDELYNEAVATNNCLVQANLRLVVSIAKKFAGAGEAFFELVSDGNATLMKAVERFDYSLGYKFSTYGSWAIQNNFRRDYAARLRHQERFRTAREEVLSVEPEYRANPYAEQIEQGEREAQVKRILRKLDQREREIIMRRFGLVRGQEPETLKQVGNDLGVSKERIRQIEVRALNKIRDAVKEKKVGLAAP